MLELEKKDSYEKFIKKFNINKEELYKFGIDETILPPIDSVSENWKDLKNRIFNDGAVKIRGYGRDAKGTSLYIDLYKYLFKNNNVKKDPTNNSEPQKIISELTNYIRNENIFNYQVSHIFGRTKNIFLFEAPWNIAFVPKVMDPFTGHESTGVLQKEYKEKFQSHASKLYAEFIEEYNYLITRPDISEGILYYIDDLKKQRDVKEVLDFKNSVLAELSVIGTDTATISKKL